MARLRGGVGSLILDADGLVKLINGDPVARTQYSAARTRRSHIVTAASTLAEVLRGGPRDARIHWALGNMEVVSIDKQAGRIAGELLGKTGLSGHRYALDALLAVVALAQRRPAVLLTSDPEDLARLTEEPGRPRAERIQVIRI